MVARSMRPFLKIFNLLKKISMHKMKNLVIYLFICFSGTLSAQVVSFGFFNNSGGDVYNPKTGKYWMDRNLGATQAATSSTDADAYGDLYQWGRAADGHQLRTSGTTNAQSSSTSPGTTFIIGSFYWYTGTDPDNLWQGVNGTNNPCSSGYRLPTEAEWEAERATWSSDDAAGAFASPLKLPMAGNRGFGNGSLLEVGTAGYYWSSTVSSNMSSGLRFTSSNANMAAWSRADGFAVRCLKEVTAPDAPGIGTATGGDAQATVSFTAPSSNGGSAITSYTATSSPGDFTGTISQSGSGSITVTGLTNGTAYTFTVTATNAIGISSASAASNSVEPAITEVGNFYQGGVVFYIFVDGDKGYVTGETHGLIAAVADQSSSIRWWNGVFYTTGATETAVGKGSDNTDDIITTQGATATSYAAGLARAYNGGGYIDWFLPSKDELNQMYTNKATINTTAAANSGSSFSNGSYWSSTEPIFKQAWYQGFSNGDQYKTWTNNSFRVRAVRAF